MCIWVNMRMAASTAKASINGQMEAVTKVILKKENDTEEAYGKETTEMFLKVSIVMIWRMDGESSPGPTDRSMKESSKMISGTVKERIVILAAKSVNSCGNKEKLTIDFTQKKRKNIGLAM